METVIAVGGIGTLVGFSLVKAYTTSTLTKLRAQCQNAMSLERHKRQEREREEHVLETAEARLSQLDADRTRLQKDLQALCDQTKEAESRLNRLKSDDDEDRADEDTQSEDSESAE